MSYLTLQSSEYLAFASFTVGATTYYIGTVPELRGGIWYDGVIQTAPQLAMNFGSALSLTQATSIDLLIGDAAGGTYRTLVDTNALDGVAVTVTLVTRQHWNNGTSTDLEYGQTLSIVGDSLAPELVTLHLQDLEDQKLSKLYPPNLWQASDWPEISSDDAGKPICEPVGTALKFPCVLLRSDPANNEYWYGVCTGTPKLISITSINSGTKTITLSTAPLYALAAGQVIIITGSSAADNRYTVASASGTTIVVNETLPASTGGNVRLMPQVLTVYRNKRVVGASEYSVQQLYFGSPVTNGDFSAIPASATWNSSIVGSGTVVFTAGNCAITCIDASNYASIYQFQGGKLGVSAFYALEVQMGAGSDGVVSKDGNPQFVAYQRRLPALKTTTVVIHSNLSGFDGFAIGVWANSGTCNIKSVRIIQIDLTLLKFTQPQIDFNGSPYAIEADVLGVEDRNASGEVRRLLEIAGASTDATTFTAAEAAAFTQNIDCDYGRSGQRKISAILDDLLYVARGGLSRDASGNYTIWQDDAGSPSITLDESLGDQVKVEKLDSAGRPSSVGLNYAPGSGDASTMQVQLTRDVVAGVLGPENPREIRYLRDAATADELLCYRALRAQYNRIGSATVYRVQANIGDVVSLTSPRNWAGARQFTVWGIQRVASGNALTLMEYNADVYTYTAGDLPPNAVTGYQPDYSFTAPAAPTALAISATTTTVANDGTTTAYVSTSATPPSVNWTAIWFVAIHNVTGEITMAKGGDIGGGVYGATISPLRPGEVYKLECYAVNATNVQGVVQSTFNATAIGGGATDTTFTSAGLAVLPPNVSSISISQGSGKLIAVSWPGVTATNLQAYSLERKTGVGAYAEIWRGNALTFNDTAVNYAGSYTYRVRALDTYGNFSGSYATSSALSPHGNITGGGNGDITTSTVDTVNRTSVTAISGSYSFTGSTFGIGFASLSITNPLGANAVCAGPSSADHAIVATLGTFGSPLHVTFSREYGGTASGTVYLYVW